MRSLSMFKPTRAFLALLGARRPSCETLDVAASHLGRRHPFDTNTWMEPSLGPLHAACIPSALNEASLGHEDGHVPKHSAIP